ncbi:MAG: phospholipase D family protein [Prosthecobacter sp.]|nr:phospholipase D family protein [Prosthecobacter sp.]
MPSSFQLIDQGWDSVLHAAAAVRCADLRIVCPFIKVRAAKRLLAGGPPERIRVITRFHLGEMCDGVNDTEALRLLLQNGAQIRGVKGLHAKLYLFGDRHAIVTSANLTEAALLRNHEFGFVSNQSEIIHRCRDYFDGLWNRAGPDLTLERLVAWESEITAVRTTGAPPASTISLPDNGVAAGFDPATMPVASPSIIAASPAAEVPQAFVKFFGDSDHRSSSDSGVLEEVKAIGCHWACTYPKSRRPRSVADGSVFFMGRMMKNPDDIVIFGRATGMRHVDGRDEASSEEIEARPWKKDWPIYIRVHHAEFIAGTLRNGVRLSALMDELKADAFAATQRNALQGEGNTDPRGAYRQQPHVELSQMGFAWVEQRLEAAIATHGKVPAGDLAALDWPTAPAAYLTVFQDWLQTSQGLKPSTAREYAYFLKRCRDHYQEIIDEWTVPNEAAADKLIEKVNRIVAERGRWADGTFDERDVRQNLRPALRQFGRFSEARKSGLMQP